MSRRRSSAARIMSHLSDNQVDRLNHLLDLTSVGDTVILDEIKASLLLRAMSAVDQLAYLSDHEFPRTYLELFGDP